MVDFFKIEKVNDHITAIKSMTGEFMFLIEGEKKAVLIDTCLGVGNLKKIVEKLTNKPITVILTHGHIDHAMGANEFETVYMNALDEPVYHQMADLKGRLDYIKMNLNGVLPAFSEEDYVETLPFHYHKLVDRQEFDLGGIHIQMLALPGHTHGMMTALLKEDRILIVGDACNKATFLFDENSLPVETYYKNLKAFQSNTKGTYDQLFVSHHEKLISNDLFDTVLAVCEDILNDTADDVPFEFMGETYYIAKKVREQFIREDGKEGNIIYNKKKVREV